MEESANVCQFQYFLAKVEDEEITPIVQHSLKLAQSHIQKITEIFNRERYPILYAFNMEEAVDITAPKLYSDTIILHYLHTMGGITLQACSIGVQLDARVA